MQTFQSVALAAPVSKIQVMTMTPAHRARRVAIVTCHSLRNLAYYRNGWQQRTLVRNDEFWRTVNGNFIDICVIEWCKLFGDVRGKHSWRKVFCNSQAFSTGLLADMQMSPSEFDNYIKKMRAYRDNFVVHLDDFPTMDIPDLDFAKKSLFYLYNCLAAIENDVVFPQGFPITASAYFCQSSDEATKGYL